MSTIRLKLPRPHSGQSNVIAGARRFNVLSCGRRWGKTVLGIDRLLPVALRGGKCGWFAPTYRILSDAWREIQWHLRPVTVDLSQQEKRLELVGGGVIEMWSMADPDAGRSRAYHCVVVDEAAMIPELQKAWQESIRPTLTDYAGGAWFFSTPKGTANFFHSLYQRGADAGEWASWQQPTASNPHISAPEIEAARQDLTDLAFAQEYLAQFVSWEGAVFRRIADATGNVKHAPACAIGVDWGRTNDYTVFAAISTEGHVVGLDRFRGVEYALQRERLKAFWQHQGARSWIFAEANSMGGPVVEQLQRDGLPVYPFLTTHASKTAIIEALALAFERGMIRIPQDPALVGELQAFEGKRTSTGMIRYAAPEGAHDDTVMALAIGWQGLAMWEKQRAQAVRPAPQEYQISPV